MLHGYLFVFVLSSNNMFHFQHPQPQPQPHPDLPPHRAVDQVSMSTEGFLRGSYLVYVNPQALFSYAVKKHEWLKRKESFLTGQHKTICKFYYCFSVRIGARAQTQLLFWCVGHDAHVQMLLLTQYLGLDAHAQMLLLFDCV